MIRKKINIALLGGILLATGLPVQAQESLKIGVISIGRLIQESPQMASAQAAMEDEFAPRLRKLRDMQAEVQRKAEQFQKDAEVMGPEERDNAQRALRNDERELVRTQNEFREDQDIRNNELLGEIQQSIRIFMQDFGQKNGYDLILAEGIVYASDRLNVTQQVIDQMKQAGGGQ